MDRYEEALERAKEIYNAPVATIVTRTFLEQIFPELKESEDERIRRCIEVALTDVDEQRFKDFGTTLKECIAYLEKQKEQKPVIFIPKFKEGDKVVSTKNEHLTYDILEVGHINELGNPEYKVEIFEDGKPGILNKPHNVKYFECRKMDEWGKLIEQKPAEWSEEDGLARDFLLKQTEQSIKVLESVKTETYIGSKGLGYVASDIRDWKNARQFILSLHPHWKPSEEQMEALMLAIEGKWEEILPTGYMSRRLEDLYEGLANTFKVECKLEE